MAKDKLGPDEETAKLNSGGPDPGDGIPIVKDPLFAFASTFTGKQASDLASIAEGQVLLGELQRKSPQFRGGLGLPEASLVAIGVSGGQESYIPSEYLVQNGFPLDKPIHLQLKIEQGAKRKTSDDQEEGNPTVHPFKTDNGIMLEVRDALDIIRRENDNGFERLFLEIKLAANYNPPKVIKAPEVVPEPVIVLPHAPVVPPVDPHAAAAPKK